MDWRKETGQNFSNSSPASSCEINFVPSATAFQESDLQLEEEAVFTGISTLADDSGLEVDALNGAPGFFSARYAHGESFNDKENRQRVLDELHDVPNEQRSG